jgi:ribose transport system permease protein
MNAVRQYVRREPAVVVAYIVLVVIVVTWILVTPRITTLSMTTTISQKLPLVLVAIGEMIVIVSRGIDLSVGGTVTLANVIVAAGSAHFGNTVLWVLVALAVVALAGMLNGVFVALLGLPALIVTLATQSILLGVALYILPNPGGHVDAWFAKLPRLLIGPIPLMAILLVAVPLVIWLPLRRSRFGTALYAVGNDSAAAFVSGIAVRRTTITAYGLSGLFAGLAGVVLAMNTGSGDATIGVSFTLTAIAAAVIGGVLLSGGRGTVTGTVAGALVLSFISNLLFGLGINAYWQHVVTGAILIIALAAPFLLGRANRRRSQRA